MSHIHIGYGDSATGCILEAIDIHGLEGEGAVPSRDDFTQGPISDCLKPDGLSQRVEYWDAVDQKLGHRFEPKEFYVKSIQILDDLEADEITIWVGDSCHDILATGWLISYLKDKKFNWFIVNLAEVKKDVFPNDQPAVNLAMYTPDRLKDLYNYRRSLSKADIEYYTTVWNKAAKENSHYRIQSRGEIISVGEEFYDEYILSFIPTQFEVASNIIGQILKDGKHRISDTTVEWNVMKMIDWEILEYTGNSSSMGSYSIRKKR